MKTILVCVIGVWMGTFAMAQQSSNFQPKFIISKKSTHKIPRGQSYLFGYLEVVENRSNPTSRTIQLPVYYFKSRSATPKPDPIIYTVGGPGSSTMPSAPYMQYYKYLDDRDVILIEQRGNYYAKPHLDCPEWAQAVHESEQPGFDEVKRDSLFQYAAKACKERLEKENIDLDGYRTTEIAADIHDLVTVLEIDTYNLLTISYSTKIAQVLLRDYPEGIRSVVMDSPLPLAVNYDEESVGNLLEMTETILADCKADSACQLAFPNLKKRFYDYLAEKTIHPLQVEVVHPKTQKTETFYLKGADLIMVMSAIPENIPFEINRLLNNDLSSIKAILSSVFKEPGLGTGLGMRLSVWCAEEYPFNDQETIKKEKERPEVAGLSPSVFEAEVCEIWGVKKAEAIENEPVKSDVPILIINGEYDAETPPKWGQAMSQNFSNSYYLLFKAWQHTPTTNWSNPCAMEAANAFFNNPTTTPNLDCFVELKTPVFKVE